MYTHVYVFAYCMYMCTYTYIHMDICTSVHMYIYIYMYVCICICIYIYIYIYIYTPVSQDGVPHPRSPQKRWAARGDPAMSVANRDMPCAGSPREVARTANSRSFNLKSSASLSEFELFKLRWDVEARHDSRIWDTTASRFGALNL